jgi:hypothetical protein
MPRCLIINTETGEQFGEYIAKHTQTNRSAPFARNAGHKAYEDWLDYPPSLDPKMS